MVLAAAFEEWREKRRREQIARAVHENDAEWDAWNERRMHRLNIAASRSRNRLPSARRRATAVD